MDNFLQKRSQIMVGYIQKVLFSMVNSMAGEDTTIQIKELAGIPIDREFQMNTVYSDEEWQRLLSATLKVLNLTMEQVYDAYADYFLKDALMRFPTWFQMSKNSYEFLSIQPTIHNCFATSAIDAKSRDAINDKFRIEKFPNKLITHYRSPNKLCGLYRSLARSVINHYGDEAGIEEKCCIQKGANECEMHILWTKLGS